MLPLFYYCFSRHYYFDAMPMLPLSGLRNIIAAAIYFMLHAISICVIIYYFIRRAFR